MILHNFLNSFVVLKFEFSIPYEEN